MFSRFWRPWLLLPALAISLCSALANEIALARLQHSEGVLSLATLEALRLWHVIPGLSGIALWLPIAARMAIQGRQSTTQPRVLVLSFLSIPWGASAHARRT